MGQPSLLSIWPHSCAAPFLSLDLFTSIEVGQTVERELGATRGSSWQRQLQGTWDVWTARVARGEGKNRPSISGGRGMNEPR